MTKDRNALKAGLFIIISVALIVAIVLAIEGAGRFAETQQTRAVTFKLTDDVGGLRAGDEVRVGGHKVGSVESIEPENLESAEPRLLVRFRLPARYKFHPGAEVGVQTSLTGASVLNVITLGRADKGEVLKDDTVLAGRPDPKTSLLASLGGAGSDVADLVAGFKARTVPQINATVDTYRQTGESARRLIEHADAKIDPVVDKYNVVADKTGGMMDSIHDMVGPSTKDWKGTIADLHEITTNFKTELPAMLTKVQGTIDNARGALEDLQKTGANAKDISESVRGVLVGNKGKLDGIFASVKTTGDNLKAASSEIRRSPWRLLYQPKQDELSNLNLYDSARQFADGANELNDAAQALRDAINSKQADPAELQKMVNKLEKSFTNFHEVEDKLWRGVKE